MDCRKLWSIVQIFLQHLAYMLRSQLKIRYLGPISVEFIIQNSLEAQDPMHKTKCSFESGTQYMQDQHILFKNWNAFCQMQYAIYGDI